MRMYSKFLVLVFFIAVVTFTACDSGGGGGDGDGNEDPKTYAIGDTGPSGVGLVFYISDGGLHGQEVSPADQDESAAWSNVTAALANGSSALPVGIGSGSTNTDTIIDHALHTESAAEICRNYRASEEGDWFLPSKDELNAIWNNLVDDGSGLTGDGETTNNGIGNFSIYLFYWSSSEDSDIQAWAQNFRLGMQGKGNKDSTTMRVRAVRAF